MESQSFDDKSDQHKSSLEWQVKHKAFKFFIAFFLVGVFNNNGYVMVQSGSNKLAEEFGQEDFMGAFQFAMTGISFMTRFVQGCLFVNTKYIHRFYITTVLALMAFSLVAWASFENKPAWFWVAVSASIFMGISQALGEATFLGFCQLFPDNVVGYVSSGTGCAGLTGTFTNLLLQNYLSEGWINIIVLPTMIFYILPAIWLNRQTLLYPNHTRKAKLRESQIDKL